MEEAADLQDWELLSPHSADDPKVFEGLDGEGDSYGGAIKSDYFALDSEKRRTERASSEEESEGGGVDSDNPSWVDPDSDPRDLERSRGKVEFRGSGFPVRNSGGFWSDGSSDCRSSPADSERGELGNRGDSVIEFGVEGIETGYQDSSDYDSEKSSDFGRSRESEENQTGLEEHGAEESGELVKIGDGSGSLESVSSSEGKKRGVVWWKMTLEFIKFYVLKMRPVWSISIAAAIMGLVMLGRKLYKMKHKSQRIQLKIAFDDKLGDFLRASILAKVEFGECLSEDLRGVAFSCIVVFDPNMKMVSLILVFFACDCNGKKASQLKVHAARLNDAFSVVRRVPIIRTFPAGGVSAWSMVPLR